MDKIELNTIKINNIEYIELEKINHNNNTYVLLSNPNNPSDYMIKKLVIENSEEYLYGLQDEKEFNEILKLFTKKYTN